jgi:SAM-dependent methyltransferase
MDPFEQALGEIQGGRVLDVATGRGGFVEILADRLAGYTQIVGIDLTETMIARAAELVDRERACFIQMDAGRLGFPGAAFDTVSISASLHHLADPDPILAEIGRVLRPGGHLILAEMHRGARSEAELTTVQLHNWAASIDLALGHPHYPTLTRQQVVDHVEALGLHKCSIYDWAGDDDDPLEKDTITTLETVIERYLTRARGLPDYAEVEAQAGALRERLREVGAHGEPRVFIIGQRAA